jgi:uncharacterized protein YoaH (UPF0181 family)
MKQTAVEWLIDKLKSQGLLIGEPNNLVAVREAKEMEKQQQEDFAIGFAEWICEKAEVPYIKGTMNGTLEIYKKEKGL